MMWLAVAAGAIAVVGLFYFFIAKTKERPVASKKEPEAPAEPSLPIDEPPVSTEAPKTHELPEAAEKVIPKAVPPRKSAPPKPEPMQEPAQSRETPSKIVDYPPFSHARAVNELGLSEEEAVDFIGEMIVQIDEEIPKLDMEVAKGNAGKVELIVHMLKGSAVSLGSGGVADVLIEFNTYCHEGSDMQIIKQHLHNLKHYQANLKEAYGC